MKKKVSKKMKAEDLFLFGWKKLLLRGLF